MESVSNMPKEFAFQLDEFYLDLQQDGSKISLLDKQEIIDSPFPGLRPFKTSEFQLFKGRDGQAEELIKRFKRNHFLAVIGSSGTGKSSLIRGGLIPQLFGGYLHEAGNKWNIAICRPGKNPIENLSIALSSVKSHSKEINKIYHEYQTIEPLLSNSIYGVLDVNEQLQKSKNESENLLIIIDQFEELFRFDRRDLNKDNIESHFVNLLLKSALNPNSSVYVIITMRSEFLGDCVRYRGLPEAINEGQYLVPQLTRNQLKEVIEGPINLAEKKISPGLVELLLNEIEETKLKENLDQLPILQHALMRTYHEAMKSGPETEINYEHYKSIGGMEKALANHAEAKFKELGEDNTDSDSLSKKQKIAKIIFQALTDLSTDQKGGRRPVELKNIHAIAISVNASQKEVDEVINHFRQNETSFIMPPINTSLYPELILDISHESLMRNWERLNKWITEEVRYGKLYKTLDERRDLYDQNMDETIRGGILDDMLFWKDHYPNNLAWASRYNQNTKNGDDQDINNYYKNIDFLVKSKLQTETEKKKIENDIKRAQKEKSTRKFIWVLGLAALISIALAGWGFNSRHIALAKEKEARAQKSVAEQNALEANAERKKADENANDAKIQKSIADKNASEATRQTLIAKTAAAFASQQEKLAEKNAKEAMQQKNLALGYLKDVQLQKDTAIAQKLIAEKKSFESDLKDSSWWSIGLLTKELKNSIRDTLFNLYFHPVDKNPTHADSLLANNFENSLNLLYEAEKKKEENWGLYLFLVKEAKDLYNNYVTRTILDSLIEVTVPFKEKFKYPDSFDEIYSLTLLPNNEIISFNRSGVYSFNNGGETKRLRSFKENMVPVCISKDASLILINNVDSGAYSLFERNKDNYYKKISFKKSPDPNNVDVKNVPNSVFKSRPNIDYFYSDTTYPESKNQIIDTKAAFSANNNLLAISESKTKNLFVYNLTNNSRKTIENNGSQNLVDLTFMNSENNLLLCYPDSLFIVNVKDLSKKPLKVEEISPRSSLTGSSNFIKAGYFSNDSLIWVTTIDKIFEGKENDLLKGKNIPESSDKIYVSPLNNYLLATSYSWYEDNNIKVYDKAFEKFNKIFPWHSNSISKIFISENGNTILSADKNEIFLWSYNDSLFKENNIDRYVDKRTLSSHYTDQAYRYYLGKRYDSAIIFYTKGIKFDSTSGDTWNMLGVTSYNLKNYDSSIKYFKKAISIDSSQIIYQINLGDSYNQKENYDTAIYVLNKTISIDSTYARAWNLLGVVNYNLKKYDTSIKYYKKAVSLDSNQVVYQANLSDAFNKKEKYDTAIYILNNALRRDSTYAYTWNILGNTNYDLKKYDTAILYYKKAIALDTIDATYWNNIGGAYFDLKKYDSAIRFYKKAIILDSINADYLDNLAFGIFSLGNLETAIKLENKAIKINQKAYWPRNGLSYFYIRSNNFDDAIQLADTAIKINSQIPNPFAHKAYALLKLGRSVEALINLKTAINLDSSYNKSYFYLACYYALKNDKQQAIENLTKAIDKGFDDDKWFNTESSFANLRNDEVFITLLKKMRANSPLK